MGEFRMPSLGADMDRGTVTKWLVQPGDQVHRGDIVAVVDTDKADVEVEVFEDGVVEEILVPVGNEVAVGTPLARIAVAAPAAPPPVAAPPIAESPAAPPPAAPPPAAESPVAEPSGAREGERPRVSPRARRLATERGVDVAALAGSGAHGAVTGADVERAQASGQPSGGQVGAGAEPHAAPVQARTQRDRAGSMRATIGRAMARSKREIPHYYLATDIDFARARAFLDDRNSARPVTERVLPAVVLLKAVAVAVRETPELNGFYVDDEVRPSEHVHLGVAIALREGGLVAPAIHDTDGKSLDDLMAALRDLAARTRAGTLRASELSEPTLTVTNLGDQGVPVVHGVIYPPQVALVGLGVIRERPWAVDGMLAVRPIVTATLAADHRVSDGARGARFLNALDRILQHPEEL